MTPLRSRDEFEVELNVDSEHEPNVEALEALVVVLAPGVVVVAPGVVAPLVLGIEVDGDMVDSGAARATGAPAPSTRVALVASAKAERRSAVR